MMGPPMKDLLAKALVRKGWRAAVSATTAATVAFMLWLAVVAPPAWAAAPTPQRLFWITDNGVYKHVACDEVAAGRHITLFNCGEPELLPRDAGNIIRAFDRQIYPTDVKNFGSPHDLQTIDVVMAPFGGMTFGYFDENDLNPAASISGAHSNHGNVLYVRSLTLMPDPNKLMNVQEALAHELQHLIDYRIRVLDRGLAPQEVWLNEGLSFFAQLSNGYWTPRDSLRVAASASDPAWSLTAMSENSQFLRQHGRVAYGRAGMFVTYLAAQYGARFTRDLIRTRQTGVKGIDAVLNQERHGDFADAFDRWGVAQLINNRARYGYHGMLSGHFLTPHLTFPTIVRYPFDSRATGRSAMALQPWTQGYARFATSIGSPVTIRIAAPPGIHLAAVYAISTAPGQTQVRWLKRTADHPVAIQLGRSGQSYDSVTLVVSATGSLHALPFDSRPATVRIQASSIDARHYQRVPRTTSAAGQNVDVTR